MRAKILLAIALLETNGPQLRQPYSKPLGDGIFEIRAKQGNNITRTLYFFYDGKQIILTNGFVKKTQKTPSAEIQRAKKYRAEYLRFKAEWDALEPELSIMQAVIDARKESGLTQQQLAERTGISQADISKLENGNANPSLKTLQRLASAMDKKLKISFV